MLRQLSGSFTIKNRAAVCEPAPSLDAGQLGLALLRTKFHLSHTFTSRACCSKGPPVPLRNLILLSLFATFIYVLLFLLLP